MEVKVVLLGPGGVGKSALCFSFLQGLWIEQYDPTIEELHRKQTTIDDREVMVTILDTAGQEEFSMMQDQWFRQGEGFFLVYSIDSKKSLDDAFRFRDRLIKCRTAAEDEATSAVPPMVFIGNKSDLAQKRQVTSADAEKRCAQVQASFFETSAKTGSNIQNAFEFLIRAVLRAKLKDSKHLSPNNSNSPTSNGTRPRSASSSSAGKEKSGGCQLL